MTDHALTEFVLAFMYNPKQVSLDTLESDELHGAPGTRRRGPKHAAPFGIVLGGLGPYHAARIAMLMPPVTAREAAALNLIAEAREVGIDAGDNCRGAGAPTG